jgi:hypothetical protein
MLKAVRPFSPPAFPYPSLPQLPPPAPASTPRPEGPFHNLSDGQLADELGQVKAEAAEVKAREDALKAELIARGVASAEGTLFRATVNETLRETLDAALIRSEMGPSWVSAHSKIGVVTTVKVSARTGAKHAA